VAGITALNIILIKTLDPSTGKISESESSTIEIVSTFIYGIFIPIAGHMCDKYPL